jgi:hypothetical protein
MTALGPRRLETKADRGADRRREGDGGMTVAAIHEVAPLEQAVQEIHKLFAAALKADGKAIKLYDESTDERMKAGRHRLKAGERLLSLRKRIEGGEAGPEWVNDWWGWYEQHFDRSRKDADKCMRMAGSPDPGAAQEAERAKAREAMARLRAGRAAAAAAANTADVSGNDDETERSAEAMKAAHAALDGGDPAKEPERAEVAKLIRVWVGASPEAKREFIRERWDEIARVRKQLDANGSAAEDRWVEGDDAQ